MPDTSTNGWGYYMQGSDQQIESEELGAWLSMLLHCGVHNNAFGQPQYECECGVLFPQWAVALAKHDNNPKLLTDRHAQGFRPTGGSLADLNSPHKQTAHE